jgi:hypothetical protein
MQKLGVYLGHKSSRPLTPPSYFVLMASGEEAFMRVSTDCTGRAEECRRLAKLAAKAEDCLHFLEMASTWDMLAKQRKVDEQLADEEVADGQVADEQLADEQLAEEQLAAQQVADEQLADEQVAAQQVADEPVADEQVADQEVADEEVANEQLAAILALAGAIANGRNLRLGP